LPATSHPIWSDIKAGSVYYYNDPALKSTYSHYCIVVNVDPGKDTAIFLVYASHRISMVQKRRKGLPRETLIEISPDQYPEFTKKSVIDCNVVLERTISMLANQFDQRKLDIKPVMGLRLVKMLRRGIIASNQIAPRIQNLLKD